MVHDRGSSMSSRICLNTASVLTSAYYLPVAVRGVRVTVVLLAAGLCTVLYLWYFPLLTIPLSSDHFLLSPFAILYCFDSRFLPGSLTLSLSMTLLLFPLCVCCSWSNS
jgi:hypothetical protein